MLYIRTFQFLRLNQTRLSGDRTSNMNFTLVTITMSFESQAFYKSLTSTSFSKSDFTSMFEVEKKRLSCVVCDPILTVSASSVLFDVSTSFFRGSILSQSAGFGVLIPHNLLAMFSPYSNPLLWVLGNSIAFSLCSVDSDKTIYQCFWPYKTRYLLTAIDWYQSV